MGLCNYFAPVITAMMLVGLAFFEANAGYTAVESVISKSRRHNIFEDIWHPQKIKELIFVVDGVISNRRRVRGLS